VKLEDPKNVTEVARLLKATIASKQYGYEEELSAIIAKACVQILPKDAKNFNVDHVRVTKILGGGVLDTKLYKGFVMNRGADGKRICSFCNSFLIKDFNRNDQARNKCKGCSICGRN